MTVSLRRTGITSVYQWIFTVLRISEPSHPILSAALPQGNANPTEGDFTYFTQLVYVIMHNSVSFS